LSKNRDGVALECYRHRKTFVGQQGVSFDQEWRAPSKMRPGISVTRIAVKPRYSEVRPRDRQSNTPPCGLAYKRFDVHALAVPAARMESPCSCERLDGLYRSLQLLTRPVLEGGLPQTTCPIGGILPLLDQLDRRHDLVEL
jgi:hypothetical protein